MKLNKNKDCYIVGAGGHAKVVIEAHLSCNYTVKGIIDEDISKHGSDILGVKVIGDFSHLENKNLPLHIAIGKNSIREKLFNGLRGYEFCAIKHISSILPNSAIIGDGTFISAGVILQTDAQIGKFCIINTGAIIEHDVMIDDFSHIAPGSVVSGGVKIGKNCLVGLGARIIPNVQIGNNVTIGAGSIVISDISDNQTVVGIPAR